MDPTDLTVYTSPFEKKRVGRNNDGGYIICDIPDINYDVMISGGIGDDLSFEEQLCDIYPNLPGLCHDGTIHCAIIQSRNKNIRIVRKNINTYNDEGNTKLFDLIQSYQTIFLKMDIEGGEFPWLQCLSEEQMNHFSQIVMEFHYPFSPDHANIFKNINKTHALVHLHGNNYGSTTDYKNVNIPEVFECTYIHKKYITNPILLNSDPLPGIYDMPNGPPIDIDLNYPPFVHTLSPSAHS